MKKELTCINCPLGCQVTVTMDDDKNIEKIEGNSCKRGEIYAKHEVKNPVRVVTSTVKLKDSDDYSVSVKTADAIPKEKMKEAMDEINKAVIKAPVHVGDVLIENIAGTDIDIVATAERK